MKMKRLAAVILSASLGISALGGCVHPQEPASAESGESTAATGSTQSPGSTATTETDGGLTSIIQASTTVNTGSGTDFIPLSNAFSAGGGDPIPGQGEGILNYDAYIRNRTTFTDMAGHEAEVAAVFLTDKGVFEKTDAFEPDSPVSIADFLHYLLAVLNRPADRASSAANALSCGLIQQGEFDSYNRPIKKQEMARILARATQDADALGQYRYLIGDIQGVQGADAIVKGVGLGYLHLDGNRFYPDQQAKKWEVADALLKLTNNGLREVMPYNAGTTALDGSGQILVKSKAVPNPSGVQLGLWTLYGQQELAFSKYGKRTIDRVDFDKWARLETSKGVYNFNFTNTQRSHKAGCTAITSINLAATATLNPAIGSSYIPSFYPQSITNETTRAAAKKFLYVYVKQFLTQVGGALYLSIDYEIDWQYRMSDATAVSRQRAEEWADWYVEACAVARQAAADAGASDKLRLIVIYNWVTELHKQGQASNQWMKRVAEASDCIGLDTYEADSSDVTNPNKTLQAMRYMINNYTYGKPFMVVENGFAIGNATGSNKGKTFGTEQQQQEYYRRLFRELRFSLLPGGYLGNNLRGFLVWALMDMSDQSYGMYTQAGKEKPVAQIVRQGFRSIETLRQFAPYILENSQNITSSSGVPMKIDSGDAFECMTLFTFSLKKKDRYVLKIKLDQPAGVLVDMNGVTALGDLSMNSRDVTLVINKGLNEGFNYLNIYLGKETLPCSLNVYSVTLE